jgi:hypothetical protein
MTTEMMTTNNAAIAERVMVLGDLAQLTAPERVQYYGAVCKSIGLNPLTKPFDYITLNNKLTLYTKKDATDQLRKINGVSIGKPDIQQVDDLIIVTVVATDATGRSDSDIGVVKRGDMRGDVANAMMKAITKAKRRVTLSICGLGFLDETEVETIPDAKPVIVAENGVIVPPAVGKPIQNGNHAQDDIKARAAKLLEWSENGGTVNADNMKSISKSVDEIAAGIGFALNQNDTAAGRLAALVGHLKAQSQPVIEPAQ